MDSKLQGEVKLVFVRAGLSKKDKLPYLILSNGRKEFFVWLDEKDDLELFKDVEEDDVVILEVRVTVGSDRVKVISVKQ